MTIEKYIDGWKTAWALARLPGAWLPLVVLAVFKVLLLVLVYFFWHPWLSRFMTPALQSVFGEEAVHFPDHMILLGGMYREVDLVVTVALGFPLIGWSLSRMSHARRRDPELVAPSALHLSKVAPSLFLILGLFALASKGVPLLVSVVNQSIASPRLQTLVWLLGLAATLVLMGALLYAPVRVVSGKIRALTAIRESIRLARNWDWLTGLIVCTGWLIRAPGEYVTANTGKFLAALGTDFVFAVLAVSIFLEAVALFYMFASATWLAVEDTREGHSRGEGPC